MKGDPGALWFYRSSRFHLNTDWQLVKQHLEYFKGGTSSVLGSPTDGLGQTLVMQLHLLSD